MSCLNSWIQSAGWGVVLPLLFAAMGITSWAIAFAKDRKPKPRKSRIHIVRGPDPICKRAWYEEMSK